MVAISRSCARWRWANDGVQAAPEHYADRSVYRYLPVNEQLMTLLGFLAREGSLSQRGGVRLAFGRRNQGWMDEMRRAFVDVFGVEPVVYQGATDAPMSCVS